MLHRSTIHARRRPPRLRWAVAIGVLVLGTLGVPRPASAQTGAPAGDRYDTAALLARTAFPQGANVALVASGENFPDALAAGSLARFHNAPILLTRRDQVPAATTQALAQLGVGDVILLGGTAAISQGVQNALSGGPYQVSRYAGEATLTTVDVYFANAGMGDPCGQVFPVQRQVRSPAVASGAVTELLRGPTAAERAQGYSSFFSDATAGYLNSVHITDGVAHADFRNFSAIIPNASTSCGSADLLAQLGSTLRQFPTVDATRYSFDGDQGAFYSFLQRSVPG